MLVLKKIAVILSLFLLTFSSYTTVFAKTDSKLALKSESAVLLDSETNSVLYSKEADKKMYPASLTKIATAIYAIENGNLDSIATISANAVRQDGTRVYLVEGEKMPLKQLVQGMLINSGNDAAVAIAEQMDGSVEQFANHLNDYLKTTVGVQHTHFTNPSGLFDKNHYTTAKDMALMTNYAMKNPIFAEIFGTKKLHWKGKSWETNLLSHHKMLIGELPYSGITGGKTGYTTESRQTLSTTADNGKIKLTAVVLKSDMKRDKYDDTALLFDYGFKSFKNSSIKQGELFKSGEREFFPEHDLLVTEDVLGSTKEISDKGILSIKNHQGKILQAVQLKLVEPEPVPVPEKNTESKEKEHSGNQMNVFYGLIMMALAAVVVGTVKKFSANS
ncbi:D-alanyl-D-alanine carboxypeptidase family protein [Neobacillus mesonae]|uniref:D-alanyl-D-alanine carboxypeptidase family protein n=1 Tax=Neobacillus mesonae TaxID=1193713 RepID=UPI000A03CFF6